MTPLEIACETMWNEAGIGLSTWEDADRALKTGFREAMRRTLLALAVNGLPQEVIKAGASEVYPIPKVSDQVAAFRCFERMLRSIATDTQGENL